MSYTLYGYWRSSATYRVRIALNIKEISYSYVPVHLVKEGGEQNAPDYQRLNPSRLVPTLVNDDNGLSLNQSIAIIQYLEFMHPQSRRLLGESARQQAEILSLSLDIAADAQPIMNLRVLNKLKSEFSADDDAVREWVQHWCNKAFSAVESRIGNKYSRFCLGSDISLVDVCLVPQVYNAVRFGVDMSAFPAIEEVVANCQKLPAFEKALPENQPDAV